MTTNDLHAEEDAGSLLVVYQELLLEVLVLFRTREQSDECPLVETTEDKVLEDPMEEHGQSKSHP